MDNSTEDSKRLLEQWQNMQVLQGTSAQASPVQNSHSHPAAVPFRQGSFTVPQAGSTQAETGDAGTKATAAVVQSAVTDAARQMGLSGETAYRQGNLTVSKALAEGVKSAASSNQEEAGTLARQKQTERMEDAAFLLGLAKSEYAQAYKDVSQYGKSILDYSTQYGSIHELEEEGNRLVERMNGGKQNGSMSLGQLQDNIHQIYEKTMDQVTADGANGLGTLVGTDGTDANMPGLSGGKSTLLSDIGSFQTKYEAQQAAIGKMTTEAAMDAGTLRALDQMRTANYKALDQRLHLSERYNSISKQGMDFRGTKEDFDKLEKFIEDNPGSFTEEERTAWDEALAANGYNASASDIANSGLMEAAGRSKARIAAGMLDDTQRAGMNTVKAGYRMGRTASQVGGSIRYLGREVMANHSTEKVNKLLNKSEQLNDRWAGKRADKTLSRYQNRLGARDSTELRDIMKESQKNARELRQQRKDLNRALSGLDRTERKLAMSRIRQQDMLLKSRGSSYRMRAERARYSALNNRRNRQKQMERIANKVRQKAGKTALGKLAGKGLRLVNGLKRGFAKFFQTVLKKFLIPAAGWAISMIWLFILLFAIAGAFMIFTEDPNDSTLSEGDQKKSALQVVNESMSNYEAEELAAMTEAIENTVRQDYDPGGYLQHGGHIEVEGDYQIRDEYGRDASICNCMQCMSLYRYYYYFAEGDSDPALAAPDFWTQNFQDKMKQIWNKTHYITTRGWFGIQHTREWNRVDIDINDLTIIGKLPDGTGYSNGGYIFHRPDQAGQCTNRVVWTETVYYETEDGTASTTIVHDYCAGHIIARADVQVDTDIRNIAKGNKLEGHYGANIQYKNFSDEEIAEITDYIGTYDTAYANGYENYADFDVYFGAAKNLVSERQVTDWLKKLTGHYGQLTEKQEAVLRTAFSGCGKFNYSMDSHTNNGLGVPGGLTDCSGFVSWVHNNCGQYPDEVSLATSGWKVYGTESYNLASLRPGSLLVMGDVAVSDGGVNHVVIWLGYQDGAPWVIDCSASTPGSACREYYPGNYKYAIPVGTTPVW